MNARHLFAMYRGEELLDIGTARELAERWRVLPGHIKYLSTPTHARRMNSNKSGNDSKARYTVKLGPEDELWEDNTHEQ